MAEYPPPALPQPQAYRAPRPSWRSIGLLWLPSVLLAGAILLPVGYLVVRAGQGETAIWDLVFRARNLEIVWNSLILAFSVTAASIGIALPLAWLTTRTDLPFRRGWALLTALPLVIPSYIGAYLFVSAMGPRGLVQGWLETLFGIERIPSLYGFPGAVYVLTVLTYPYILLNLRAALAGMDPTIEEAARSLGHTPWQTFWRVTFPQLRPALAAGSLLVILYTLRDFGAVAILRYDTFTRAIYVQYQSSLDRSAAAALALILIVITLLLLAAETRWQTSARQYSSTARVRPPTIIALGKWKGPALVFCMGVVLAALLLPALNLGYWLVRGVQAGEEIRALWGASWNSFSISLMAAFVTVAASLPISILRVRRAGRVPQLLERMMYVGFALPGIVIALALVFFGANYLPWLYQTAPMLIFAYVILFLPQALGAVQASLLTVHPNLEEAGRSLGHGPLTVFRRITLPLVRPGLGAGTALIFLTVMKELPATLILSPLGFKTLATSVWGAVSEAFFAQAAAPALLLILVSSVPMAFLTIRKQI
ncbi:MAG: iron ABC transporter permease [Anaerolineales bacterium]|nr:iron ABC transporter permease [Anaerolineales bacterium]